VGCQPNRMAPALRIIGDVVPDQKAVGPKKLSVLRGIEARVEEGLAVVGADRFAVIRTAREHQRRSGSGVPGEPLEHETLILSLEVEGAVPGKDPFEAAAEIYFPHVAHKPLAGREASTAHRDHRRGRVDPKDLAAARHQIPGDRVTHPAAEVEDCPPAGHVGQESIQPALLQEAATPVAVVVGRMSFVEIDDVSCAHLRPLQKPCLPAVLYP